MLVQEGNQTVSHNYFKIIINNVHYRHCIEGDYIY